ncbi:hypothetical protein G6F43_006910 [Rhizopus delemar]|nr:hypothetical protein G6F43_006910 [Rhizopus delemar]
MAKRIPANQENSINTMYTNKPFYNFDDYSQLRLVRSKFHNPSTCLYRRASNTTTNDLRLRPITIWTLADTGTNNATVSAGNALCDICDPFKTSQCIPILDNKDPNGHLNRLADIMLLQSISEKPV